MRRRHLTIAQRAEIGLLLLEEEKRAKERLSKFAKIKAETIERDKTGKFKESKDSKILESLELKKEIEEIKRKLGTGKATKIVGDKVKVSDKTIEKAKI